MQTFSREPYGTYASRRAEYLAFAAAHEHRSIPPEARVSGVRRLETQRVTGWAATGFFPQIACLELGRPVNPAPLLDAVDYVEAGLDCQDFTLAGLLRLLYRHGRKERLDPGLRERVERCVLSAAYWCDEPGEGPAVCWHTENHQGLYHSCELLAGQRFPDARFDHAGMTGRQHVEKATGLLDAWLHWRERLGWCEWLSNHYYPEDILTLCNLHDFAEAPVLRERAAALLDGLLLEIAMHSHRGVMGCPHGRTYASDVVDGRREPISPVCRLISGMGIFNSPGNPGAIALCTSDYALPPAIGAVARDTGAEVEVCQRSSVNVEDAPSHGLRYDSEDDNRYFAALHAHYHPLVVHTSRRVQEKTGLYWLNPDFDRHIERLGDNGGDWVATGQDRFLLSEANVRTWKSPHCALSSVQDFRPGGHGFQQHVWQATFDEETVVFTNHPRSDDLWGGVPTVFAGNNVLPRVGQVRNVLIAIHRVPPDHSFPGSHAYFPRERFDEVREQAGWVLARKGDGVIALRSQHVARFDRIEKGSWAGWALRADAPDNAWICEVGHAGRWSSFDQFCRRVVDSAVVFANGAVTYRSPSVGLVRFGWSEPLTLDGAPVPLRFTRRYEAPYLRCNETGLRLEVERAGHRLELDFEHHRRHVQEPATTTR